MAQELIMDTSSGLEQADVARKNDPAKAEELYRSILATKAGTSTAGPSEDQHADMAANESILKDQETALLKLGALYRDNE